jgi:hypothetical protein
MISVYVLRTHFVNESVLELYEQLKFDFGKESVFMILDTTHCQTPTNTDNVISIDTEMAVAINPLHLQFKNHGLSFRTEAVILRAYDEIRAKGLVFDYLWIIEYDIYCKEGFGNALALCDGIECDFLAKGGDDRVTIRTYNTHPGWCWWNALYGEISHMPLKQRQGCFFPLTRYSHRMIDVLRNNLGKSTGFCEVYLPCLCVANNLEYKAIPSEVFGQFQFRPNLQYKKLLETAIPNKLYHPYKRDK